MIDRYCRKEMHDIWTDEAKFNAYLKVEIEACKAWSKLLLRPKERLSRTTTLFP